MPPRSPQKSKMGCITCRVRKVKCDERKPACMRCISAGRTCDGYRSNFRIFDGTESAFSITTPPVPASESTESLVVFPGLEHVEYLARHFTIKPTPSMGATYGTGISYEAEARATLGATSDPAVNHALASLNALRKAYDDQYGTSLPESVYAVTPSTPGVQYGLKKYVHAIKSLSATILNANASANKSALLCCQMFMSIELALDDFYSATQHFIRGFCIMHKCRSRPYLREDGSIVAARSMDMPAVDIFSIKLFLTPCPDGLTDDFILSSNLEPRTTRVLTTERAAVVQSNMRLATLGRFTLHLLKEISQLSPTSSASRVFRDKLTILEQLEKWKGDFATIENSTVCQMTSHARLCTAFSLYFCVTLQIIATLAIRPPGLEVKIAEPMFKEQLEVAQNLNHLKKSRKEARQQQMLQNDFLVSPV